MRTAAMDRIGEAASKVTVTAGAGGALWGWLTAEILFSLLGAFVAIAGLLVTWYYKRKADARHAVQLAIEEREAALRAQLIQERIEHLRRTAPASAVVTDSAWGELGDI